MYYARIVGFSKTFLAQLCCIPLKYREGCNIIYDIIQNSVLHGVWSLLDKDLRFVSYVTNSARDFAQAEMKSMSLSNQFKIPIEDINPHRLRTFSLIAIDRAHKQKTSFFRSFLQACVDNHDHVIDDPNLDLADDILFFCDNMIDLPELEEQNLPKRNRAFISVVSLALLCYIQNERSNLF